MEPELLSELLDAATAEVPQRYQTPPLAGIERRVRRRRAATAAVVSVAVVVILGGLAAAAAVAASPTQRHPAVPSSPASPDPAALPWLSAMVARDDRTITVYAGATGCRDLVGSRAELTAADAGQVVIAVYGRIVNAGDCATAGRAVPVVVHLPDDLGTREVRDRAGGSHPVYRQRDLPDMEAAGWPPAGGSWNADNDGWYQAFNGPNGGISISLLAQPTAEAMDFGPAVTTVRIGGHQGSITGGQHGQWRVYWQVDDVTYALLFVPAEGGRSTLTQFTQLLNTLKWS